MSYRKFYFFSVIGILLASFYPIYMGAKVLLESISNGSVDIANYPKYVIPYTPICIALIISIVLLPLIFKLFKKYDFLVASLLGAGTFFASEIGFEQIKVITGIAKIPLQDWQLSLCYINPELTQKIILTPNYAADNPAFKVHFYIIALLIVLAVINVIYGFSKMIREKNFDRNRPLTAQAVSIAIFIGLCIWACFTAFYRTGSLMVSPVSAILMTIFFITMGVSSGIYIGSFFYNKGRLLSAILPAIISMVMTFVMYIGELVLKDGVLFQLGNGFLFEPLGAIPFAIMDLAVILLSGIMTYLIILKLIMQNKNSATIENERT